MESIIKEPEVLDCLEIEEAAGVLQDLSRAGYALRGNRFEHVSDGVTVRPPEGFIEVIERSPGMVLAEYFNREYDASVESPDNLDRVRQWRAGLGDIAALEHVSKNQALIGDTLGDEKYEAQIGLASYAIRAVLRMSYAGYIFCSRSMTFKTPGEMPVFHVDDDLKGALDFVPHLICDGLVIELRKRAGGDTALPEDAIDRIDCLAGLRSDVTLLSGELAIIAMPALNRWNGF
jgi:hypothetical protein